jgi:hypothetical protein
MALLVAVGAADAKNFRASVLVLVAMPQLV